MKRLVASAVVLLALAASAIAEEATGIISAIDASARTMTLDNGATYDLPEEFDITVIEAGMKVLVVFDEIDGRNLITDMEEAE